MVGPSEEVLVDGEGWSDEEITTFLRRKAALEKGMNEMDAERLAQQMLHRDRPDSGDDRRICLECVHFVKSRCRRGLVSVWTILQRCDLFKLRGGKDA